ncbi:MAG: cytochrome c family protein, partial [Proteobacteria bacterium]|nr:cytochrome c family protein [Pseudomonadota bacterium]
MDKQRPLLRLAGVLCVLALLTVFGIEVSGAMEEAPAPEAARPDIYLIDTMATYGTLELPAVTFYHDKHTDALLKENKDCKTCHLEKDGTISLKFKRVENGDAAEVKNIYHDNCFACHAETKAAGKDSGPTDGECRSCHTLKPKAISSKMDAGFTNALHARHFGSSEIMVPGEKENCGACHHVYDKGAKKTVYTKGEESSCGSCHQADAVKDETLGVEVKALSTAVHQDCVLCHLDLSAKNKDAGPTQCKGCHGALGQTKTAEDNAKAIAKLGGKVPPLPMKGKPEATLLLPKPAVGDTKPVNMAPVAFDHTKHEAANDTCRVCHHQGMKSCVECHSVAGAKEGNFVTLADAMHSKQADSSCVGCHRVEQTDAKCAGCHWMSNKAAPPADNSCKKCHQALPEGIGGENFAPTKEEKAVYGAMMLTSGRGEATVYTNDDIPETVKVGSIAKEYEAAEFPHRKVVLKIMEGMKDDSLAASFHSGDVSMCQGCHHNSPKALKPPRCSNCHGSPFVESAPGRPGLKAAYHGQCIGCHKAMGINELKKGSETLPAQSCVVC